MATIDSNSAAVDVARPNETLTDHSESGPFRDLLPQLNRIAPLLALIYIPILLGLVALVVVYWITGIPLRIFFIDPVAEFNSPMYIGFVSNLGVLLWGAAAATCLFGGWLALKSQHQNEGAWFLICVGSLSAVLMMDDLFLLHEEVIEDHLMINQKFVFAAYGVWLLWILFRFRNVVLRTDYLIFMFASVFFAISVGVDLLVEPENFVIFGSFPGRHIIEDGFKLLGIASWATYLVRSSMQTLAPLVRKS